jgi:PAS domain S-box-containing protein
MGTQLRVIDMIRTGLQSVSTDQLVTSSRVWREVGEVMSREVAVIAPAAGVVTAAEMMAAKNVSCLVVEDDAQVAGVLTETDFLKRLVATQRDYRDVRVAEIMSHPVESVSPDVSVFDASQFVTRNRIKRLPIVEDGRLVGIVTQTDLVRALTSSGMWDSVAEIMTPDLVGVPRDALLAEAAEVMHSHDVSCVLAMEGDRPVGVLTKKDVLKRVIARRRDPGRVTVEEVMSAPVIAIPAYYSVFSASRTMAAKRVRRLVVEEHGRVRGIVAQTDVLRAVGRKMAEEEAEHLALLEAADNAVFTVDLDGHVTYVNPAFLRLFDVGDPAEFVGQPFLPERFWVNPECRGPLLEELESGNTDVKELALKTGRGRRLYVTLFLTFTRNGGGEINGSQGIIYDVTDQRELATLRAAEQALRESENRYRLLAEHAKDVIWTSDLGLKWSYVSPSVELLRGYTAEETMRQTIDEILARPSAAIAYRALGEQLDLAKQHDDAASRTWTQELEFRRKDGGTVWTETKVSFVCGDDGEPFGLVGVVRDITERKLAGEELQQYAAALENANDALRASYRAAQSATKAKTEFLANMSHEIRTPMTAILGFADVLEERLRNPEDVEAIDTIKRNGQYLLKIINDILDLSRIESGNLPVERVACAPQEIVREVVSLMRIRADANQLTLAVEYPAPIPSTIHTDPLRLKQILINLVGNAIKFTDSGGVRIVVEPVRVGQPDSKLRFDVIDTGLGMSRQQVGRLFKPFVQGDNSTTRRFGGSGLGLTIAKRTAALLGGDVTVASAPGQGSTFSVTIATGSLENVPLAHVPSCEASDEPPKPPSGNSPVRLDCRVLLAEDGPDNQRLLCLVLAKAGADVTVVSNGEEALHEVLGPPPGSADMPDPSRGTFDLILMDMQMPVLDGYQATRALRDAGHQGPIIALTAHAMKGDRQKCLDAGCDDYLAKPIDHRGLIETVAAAVAASHPA